MRLVLGASRVVAVLSVVLLGCGSDAVVSNTSDSTPGTASAEVALDDPSPAGPISWSADDLNGISLELKDLEASGEWEELPGETLLFSFPCTGEAPSPQFESRSRVRTFVETTSGFTIEQVVFSFAADQDAIELLMRWEQQLLDCPGVPVDGGTDGIQVLMLGLPAQNSGDETRILLDYQDGTGRPLRETVGAWDRHDNIVVYVAIGQRGLRTTTLDDTLEILRGIVGSRADQLIATR